MQHPTPLSIETTIAALHALRGDIARWLNVTNISADRLWLIERRKQAIHDLEGQLRSGTRWLDVPRRHALVVHEGAFTIGSVS